MKCFLLTVIAGFATVSAVVADELTDAHNVLLLYSKAIATDISCGTDSQIGLRSRLPCMTRSGC
jgi:hypothetical protein